MKNCTKMTALASMYSGLEYMLKKYGAKIICVDGTHGTNLYDIELTTSPCVR